MNFTVKTSSQSKDGSLNVYHEEQHEPKIGFERKYYQRYSCGGSASDWVDDCRLRLAKGENRCQLKRQYYIITYTFLNTVVCPLII